MSIEENNNASHGEVTNNGEQVQASGSEQKTSYSDETSSNHSGLSRRGFLGLGLVAAAGAVVGGAAGAGVVVAGSNAAGQSEPQQPGSSGSNTEPNSSAEGTNATDVNQTYDTGITVDAKYEIVDNHLHYLDFTQKTDGIEALVAKMDEAGVSQAVLFGMAMAKQWDEDTDKRPDYYLSNDSRAYYYSGTDFIMMEALEAATPEQQARFLPFICGINPNDRLSVEHIRQLLEIYPGKFAGIGELMSRHDDLTALTYGEPPHLDHPAFLEIFDLAAEHDMPVLIHHNVAGSYMDDPIYLEELKLGLAHNRLTRIIWAHVGISRRVEITNLPEITEDLLLNNENLWIDISWVVFDDYINKDADSLQLWADLIERYPTRFMIGSDKVGHWDGYPEMITRYYPLIDLLSPDAARRLCKDNILSVIKR